ncbi:hypothetical protein [Verrucomicrobium sp. BvORR034]|uniref:hypothetical protein n=1 Tax=Verrucomicrobium sp. BvORR034 TaxID=1396418 RepID=UPI00067843F9|nr:hypothetical protein [Verrucomicrobium sp. BvORR034]
MITLPLSATSVLNWFRLLTLAALLCLSLTAELGAAETAKWDWSAPIPVEYTTKPSPRAHRTVAEVEAYFKANPGQPKLQSLMDHFGPPDAVSRQFMNSQTKGSAGLSKDGYTLRFLLDDGGEVHVWAPEKFSPNLVIRYEKGGKGHLLWK